jgi:hypothetical protein
MQKTRGVNELIRHPLSTSSRGSIVSIIGMVLVIALSSLERIIKAVRSTELLSSFYA